MKNFSVQAIQRHRNAPRGRRTIHVLLLLRVEELRSSPVSSLMTFDILKTLSTPTGVLHSGRNEAEGFEKSLLSNLIRDETEEESAGFFGSGLAQGGRSYPMKQVFYRARKEYLLNRPGRHPAPPVPDTEIIEYFQVPCTRGDLKQDFPPVFLVLG